MRKSLLFAAAVAMFFSCSQDESVSPVIMDDVSNLVPIQLNVGSAVQQTTRGTGAVGDVSGASNVWGGQKVYVYMFKKGTLDLAEFRNLPIYSNKEFVVAGTTVEGTENTIEAQTSDGSIDYYPPTGSYDFWGYRLDDAVEPGYAPVFSGDKTKLVADFKIDGSQDIMIAKAENTKTNPDDADVNDRKYSAFSARHGLQPELQFQHLLTRLKFFAIAGVQDAAVGDDAVSIESITIISKTTGKLVVAYTGNDIPRITDMGTPKELALKERSDDDTNKALQPLTRTKLQWDDETNGGVELQIGESMIVYPETSYKARVVLHQNIKVDNTSPREDVLYGYDFDLNTEGGFLAGHSYNIKLTFYGLQKIKTSMSLAPWDEVNDEKLEFNEEIDFAK